MVGRKMRSAESEADGVTDMASEIYDLRCTIYDWAEARDGDAEADANMARLVDGV